MKMSSREKVLLIVLVFSVLGYIFYSFIYEPQKESIMKLEDELKLNEQLLQAHLTAKDQIPVYKEEIGQLEVDLGSKLSIYLSKVEQEDIIIYIHEELKESDLDVESLQFTPFTSTEADGSINHEIMTVNFPISGRYQDVMVLLNRFWNFDQNVYVKNLDITSDEENGTDFVSSTVSIDFIKVNDELANDLPFAEWSYSEDNDIENPFSKGSKNYFFNPNYNYLR